MLDDYDLPWLEFNVYGGIMHGMKVNSSSSVSWCLVDGMKC